MSVKAPRIVRFQYPLSNQAWGFPRGATERKVKPWVLMCIHITGNRSTAAMPVGIGKGTGTWAEVQYMARRRTAADIGNSAHDYIARDGSVLACIPTSIAAWNNGQLNRPNLKLDSVRAIAERDRKDPSFNPNEAYVREVECTGYPGSFPLTKDQRETVAYLIARDSIRWGLPITRETVHMHRDLDSVNRASCPFTGDEEAQLSRVIERARQIKADLKDPAPDPDPEPDPDPCADTEAALEAALGDIEEMEARIAELEKRPESCIVAVNADRNGMLDELAEWIAEHRA
jgi:hypothetical protein